MITPLAPGIRQQEIAPSWAPQGSPSIDDLHLLVVDECLLLAILSTSLRAMGCHVYGACSGQEAIRILQTTAVDLVLLDLCLPDMDGHALCSQIRQQFQLPVVVMSALRESVDILLAFHAGADAYVQKPFQFRDLAQKLQRAIANQTSPIAAPLSCPPEPLPGSEQELSATWLKVVETTFWYETPEPVFHTRPAFQCRAVDCPDNLLAPLVGQ